MTIKGPIMQKTFPFHTSSWCGLGLYRTHEPKNTISYAIFNAAERQNKDTNILFMLVCQQAYYSLSSMHFKRMHPKMEIDKPRSFFYVNIETTINVSQVFNWQHFRWVNRAFYSWIPHYCSLYDHRRYLAEVTFRKFDALLESLRIFTNTSISF